MLMIDYVSVIHGVLVSRCVLVLHFVPVFTVSLCVTVFQCFLVLSVSLCPSVSLLVFSFHFFLFVSQLKHTISSPAGHTNSPVSSFPQSPHV